MTIQKIRQQWNKEKEYYKTQEVGSGLHSFIKDVLESEELFQLTEGKLSTKTESRKNEYIHEKKAKEKRKADFVIFINQDILIPVEAECYGNIKAGIKQLINYQKDFDKHYGILTDGYTWRFYNNNIFREFTLEQIFSETEVLLSFWKEYIKPEFYYLSFFEPQGQLSLLKEEQILPVEQNRQIFFEDTTKLIKSFKNKLQVDGYFQDLEKKEREKKAVEITYAYIIQFILYKVLVDNEFGKFQEEFSESVKKIHQHIKDKRFKDILGITDGISNQISKNIYRPFAKEQDFIHTKLLELYRSVENKLSDVSPWLDIFVFIKKYNFSNIQNEIFGYIYENYLKELYEETKKGQYFTDPAVVNFMLEQTGYNSKNLQKRYEDDKDSISIIDPSCGSGTFLYSAVDKIIDTFGNHTEEKSKKVEELVNGNVFGLDIAEFPLYLAEMSILMRMLPLIISEKYNNPIDKKIKVFLTKDSVAEFINEGLKNTTNDIDVAGGQFSLFDASKLNLEYQSYVRDETDLAEMKQSMRPPRRRFDFVIGNPPYIGYNECSKQEILFVKLIQEKKIHMSDIYGMNLNTVPGRIKAYAPKPNLYAFFIALGLGLLKDNGKLCYIIPQTILTAGDLDVLRYHLAKFTTIEKIITFPNSLFVGRGLKQKVKVATSSLIFVVSRVKPSVLNPIEIINYNNSNDDIKVTLQNIFEGKKVSKKTIRQGEFLKNVSNWNFIKQDKRHRECMAYYNRNDSFDAYRIPESSKSKFNSVFYFDKGLVFPKNKIARFSVSDNIDFFYMIKTDKNKYYLSLNNLAIHLSDIRFPKGSQGIVVYEKKYKIVWSYMNPGRFYFSDKRIMVNFNWVLISSDNKEEMIYILSLLNSSVNKFIFQSLLKNENEKNLLIGIKAIKEFVRVPVINGFNKHIKEEIIERTEEILNLEKVKLADLVDFSKVMQQKFDGVTINSGNLSLISEGKFIHCKIISDRQLVSKIINQNYTDNKLFKDKKISLSDLKSLSALDLEKQSQLKDYIDNLVFALYFNIPLDKLGLNKAEEIKTKCAKNTYYKIIILPINK